MSWWNAKYPNNHGEYEITFASKNYEKAKAVEKVCCAVIDKDVKSPLDIEAVVRCENCKHRKYDDIFGMLWCNLDSCTKRVKPDDFCSYGERKEGADNG